MKAAPLSKKKEKSLCLLIVPCVIVFYCVFIVYNFMFLYYYIYIICQIVMQSCGGRCGKITITNKRYD